MTTSKKKSSKTKAEKLAVVDHQVEETFNIGQMIVDAAIKHIGKKETKGNSGWEDKQFEAEMKLTGWQPGQAWCSYFAELVWTEAYSKYNSLMVNVIRKLFSANAVQTFDNFNTSFFETGPSASNKEFSPKPGDLAIWMLIKGGQPSHVKGTKWIQGHIGVVQEVTVKNFKSIEGNTNSDGGREGIEVAVKTREFDYTKDHGLRLIGFVRPKE